MASASAFKEKAASGYKEKAEESEVEV